MHNCHEIRAGAFIHTRERMQIPLHSCPARQLDSSLCKMGFQEFTFQKIDNTTRDS